VSGEHNKVGLGTCVALVMANMIGTGVFASLGFQVAALPSPFLIVVLWILGGLVALCGALSYAELAAALPRSGGEYNFLTQVYHPAVGFMGGFVSVVVGFAAPIAATAMISGAYLAAAFPGLPAFGASFAVALGLAAMHAVTIRTSGLFQVLVTGLKIGLILAFLVFGIWKGHAPEQGFGPRPGDWTAMVSAPFAISLMYVLYSYTGWNAAAYIMSEVRRPERTVPRALLLATILVTILYVGLNAVFLASGPMEDFADKKEVGEIAARHLLGESGGRIMAGLIGFGLVSAISAMTWAGPRVAQTIGQDFPALGFLAQTSAGGVPRRALALQTAIVVTLLATGTFEAIIAYAFVAILTCSFLAVLGVIVLRVRKPQLARPFRCWGYPVTPLVFLLLNGFTLVYTIQEKPFEAIAGIATLAAGIGLYFVAKRPKIPS
jgi:APA family basic amino acid/polyamine antiporter